MRYFLVFYCVIGLDGVVVGLGDISCQSFLEFPSRKDVVSLVKEGLKSPGDTIAITNIIELEEEEYNQWRK